MEFHPLAIPTPGGFAFGEHRGQPGFIGVGERLVDEAVEQFFECILFVKLLAHIAASAASVRSMQSSSVRRIRRSVSDTALGCLPVAVAMALTDAPGS